MKKHTLAPSAVTVAVYAVMGNARKACIVAMCLGGALISHASAMTANPILSRGKTVYTSSGSVTYLTDNKFGLSVQSFTITNNSWMAIKVGEGSTQVFFNWNSPKEAWSNVMSPTQCPNNNPMPVDYTLQTSSNSTNGSDGIWDTAAMITGNLVEARGHLIPFTGASWVKMNISNGGGSIDEIEVFDASKGAEDVWFFPGTSITQMAYKSTPPAQDFADLVTQAHPGFNPAMIRGGIGCITTTDMVNNLPKYLSMAGNVQYWAIEQGTNDAWAGSSNTTTFTKNMQLIIDSCKAAGVQPIIARIIATNPTQAGWQVSSAFLTAVDSLTTQNKLIPGPDLYTYFLNNPAEHNSDGIHPNATGAASIQRLWAQTMDSLYKTTSVVKEGNGSVISKSAQCFFLSSIKGQITIHALRAGTLRIFSINGAEQKSLKIPAAGSYSLPATSGVCIARFSSE
jgi:lysophospholipase L1-like esterase